MGPYQDPISFEQSENESSAQHQTNPSGNKPLSSRNRTPQVTFADGFQLSSSPMVQNYRANSTRIIDTGNRQNTNYGLTEEETIQITAFTLESAASTCFRAEIRGSISCEEFLEQFKTRFLSADSQAKLLAEIKARTQETGESLAEYITKMQVMFLHLDQEVPIGKQMDIIYKNLHPKFAMNTIQILYSVNKNLAWSRNSSRNAWRLTATDTTNEINATNTALRKPNLIIDTNSGKKVKHSKTSFTQTDLIPVPITLPVNTRKLAAGTVNAAPDPLIVIRELENRKAAAVEIGTNTEDMSTNTEEIKIDNEKVSYIGAAYDEVSPLGDERFNALIDTGATRTFIGPLVGEMVKDNIIDAGRVIKVADGSEVELLGCVVLKLEANKENCILPVRICSVLSYNVGSEWTSLTRSK
ncbi:hypothetical protein PV327_008751 [Microctonus hyperodae]|uniref:Retrotransposon gag domain-containing protein n=1 Tax=Microctonus hyperodae TaxID=165561 RepID=A0AA39FTF0_MICHY|nr:hypothetical protein PV327_008751 [Microctonus hyperodae]